VLSRWLDRRSAQEAAPAEVAKARRAAERGDAVAAARAWLAAAREGHAEAQRELGICYESGRGVLADPSAALRWFQAAAEAGDMIAQGRIASFHANGFEDWKANPDGKRTQLPKDLMVAREWAERAAGQGHVESQVLMGWLLTQNSEEASATKPKSGWGCC
jgi:TPR repeat protein